MNQPGLHKLLTLPALMWTSSLAAPINCFRRVERITKCTAYDCPCATTFGLIGYSLQKWTAKPKLLLGVSVRRGPEQLRCKHGAGHLTCIRESPDLLPSHTPGVFSRGVAGAVPSIPRVPTCLPVMTWQVELGSQYRTLKLARQDIHKHNVVTVRSDACCLPQSPNFPKSHPIVDGSCPLI